MNKQTLEKTLTVLGWVIGIVVAFFLATAWPSSPTYECDSGDGTTFTASAPCEEDR